jgi:hypothetical protein
MLLLADFSGKPDILCAREVHLFLVPKYFSLQPLLCLLVSDLPYFLTHIQADFAAKLAHLLVLTQLSLFQLPH